MKLHHHAPAWPTAQEEQLLRAALLQGQGALTAWQRWQAAADYVHVDQATFCLLPLLYWNLQQQGVDDPWLAICKGIYRQTWYKNQQACQQFANPLKRLQSAGIPTLLMHDVAIALNYYPQPGLRAIPKLDLWVPPEQVLSAVALLRMDAWTTKAQHKALFARKQLAQGLRKEFEHPTGLKIDLHLGSAPNDSFSLAENQSLSAIAFTINQVAVLGLNPTEQFLQICTQVYSTPYARNVTQWLADAMLILRSPVASIDWPYLQARAQQQALVLRLREALHYLHRTLDAPIPASILQQLAQTPVHRFEQIEATVASRSASATALFVHLWANQQRQRWVHHQGGTAPNRNFIQQLQYYWDLTHAWQVPFYLGAAAARRLKWTAQRKPRKAHG